MLSNFNLDESKYRKEKDPHVEFITHYINEEEGVSYEVEGKNEITAIRYFPGANDRHLRCPLTYDPLEETLKVDEYGDISFESEKGRLDSFAEQLDRHSHKDPNYEDTSAYIVVYAGRRARAGEAGARAARAKEYLVKERGIDPVRITAVDGGHREELTVELYLVPPGEKPPIPEPTVDPNEVQIIRGSGVRSKRRSSRPRCK